MQSQFIPPAHLFPNDKRFTDLTGRSYGRWTVLHYCGKQGIDHLWVCRCQCGSEKAVRSGDLKKGTSLSCGCIRKEVVGARNLTHGLSGTPEHIVWKGMRRRCFNPNDLAYKNYGARGIGICDRWASFENFFADMGNRPTAKHTLERIDNERGYSPDNCCWATRTEQNRNQRSNRLITFRGETRPLAEWAELLGIPYSRLHIRLFRGWSIERTLTTS